MNYEKKYKEANDKIEARFGINVAKEIFTDLYESEDERIRKELLKHCINRRDCKQVCVDASDYRRWADWLFRQSVENIPNVKSDKEISNEIIKFLELPHPQFVGKRHQEEWIVWLEKQGSYTKKDVDDAYLKGISDAKNEIEKQYEANYQIRKDIATFIFNYRGDLKDRAKWMDYLGIKVSFVKNQDEQNPQSSLTPKSALEAAKEKKVDNQNCVNPTDKNEPKFHEGEWVVYNHDICQIVKREEGCNKLVTVFGIEKELVNERNLSTAHLWTIQDAKDGDVLACNGEILLFKSYSVQGRISLYCWYNGQTNNFHNKEVVDVLLTKRNKVCPATKEQRDLLFSKMKEAGYEWYADKKELKIVDWSKHIKYNPNTPSITEEKPTWTEEDEKKLSDISSILRGGEGCYYNSPVLIDWLKSLKERIGG